MSITIRDYRDSDFSVCRSLWEELTAHHAKIYGDPSIGGNDPGQGFELYVNDAQRRATWVAEAEGRVVGCVGLIMDSNADANEAEIEPVIVSTGYRGKGIGTQLLRHAVTEAKRLGIVALNIRPVARNEGALRLFAREGFDVIGHVGLFQNLSQSFYKKWKPGIVIHGTQLRY